MADNLWYFECRGFRPHAICLDYTLYDGCRDSRYRLCSCDVFPVFVKLAPYYGSNEPRLSSDCILKLCGVNMVSTKR